MHHPTLMTNSYQWHKFAESESEIPVQANGIAVIVIESKKICLAKYQHSWYGFPFQCPHAGGALGSGYIDMLGNVVCPLHGYKFSVKNGRNTSGEDYYIKTYPVEVRGDGMYVGVPG